LRPGLQDGGIVHFKIKKKTQLKKLMEAYCARQSLQMEQIRFLFDGNRLRDSQTPDELEMEDDDVIDAMLFQVGGY
jgi:small ubiquitin-related modifier